MINSTTNFRVQNWAKLKDKHHRDKQKLFLVEGYHLVNEGLKTGHVKEIITTEKTGKLDVSAEVQVHQVTQDVMQKVSSLATPTKIIGVCYKKDTPVGHSQSIACGNRLLLVDQVHHPGNLGTIIRNAVAFNIDTIVVNNSVDIYNQKVIQASQGMIFHINILKRPIISFITEIKPQGYQIIGTDVKECVPLHTVKPQEKHAILIGNEGEGLSGELFEMCDIRVNIEMNEKCESLNVGVAAGIVMYFLASR